MKTTVTISISVFSGSWWPSPYSCNKYKRKTSNCL